MKLVRIPNHDKSNVIRVTPVDFGPESLEYLDLMIEPQVYVDVSSHLFSQNLSPYFSVLRGNPIYEADKTNLSELLEDSEINGLMNSDPGIGVVFPEKYGKSGALIKKGEIVAFFRSTPYDYFYSFEAVQPKVLNDALLEYAQNGLVIPTELDTKNKSVTFQYDLRNTLRLTPKRRPVKSVWEVHLNSYLVTEWRKWRNITRTY